MIDYTSVVNQQVKIIRERLIPALIPQESLQIMIVGFDEDLSVTDVFGFPNSALCDAGNLEDMITKRLKTGCASNYLVQVQGSICTDRKIFDTSLLHDAVMLICGGSEGAQIYCYKIQVSSHKLITGIEAFTDPVAWVGAFADLLVPRPRLLN